MIEARVFVDSLDDAKNILAQESAELKGKYKIHDTIYQNVDKSIPLIEEFLRLRVVPENIWEEKEVILALKQTELRKIGKNSHIPIKLQYNKREEAEAYYEQNLKDDYLKDFEFWRIGWQYFLPNGDVVDLEIIEDKYPSIELKSKTDTSMEELLNRFNVKKEDVITGPSVVAVRNMITNANKINVESFHEILTVGGHTNSLGRADEVFRAVQDDPLRMDELFKCISAEDAWVRMRAVDTFEKLVKNDPSVVRPYLPSIFTELTRSSQPSVQWHIAQIFTEVALTKQQQVDATAWLENKLKSVDIDWIVSVNAMKSLLYFYKKKLVSREELELLLTVQAEHKSKSVRKKAKTFLQEIAERI